MKFLWPELLWLAAALPLLVVGYVLLLRRKKKLAIRYASLAIVKDAMTTGSRWRRHVPPALFLAALGVTLLAIALGQALHGVVSALSRNRKLLLVLLQQEIDVAIQFGRLGLVLGLLAAQGFDLTAHGGGSVL